MTLKQSEEVLESSHTINAVTENQSAARVALQKIVEVEILLILQKETFMHNRRACHSSD